LRCGLDAVPNFDRIAAPAGRRGGFGTFGWTMWAAGMTRNSSRLAVNLTSGSTSWASNSKSPPAAFSTRRLTRKPQGTARQLAHPTFLPGGPGYDRGRLTSVPGPGAGNHDSPIALLLPHLPRAPEAGETTSRAGRGHPTARKQGSGRYLITRTGAVNLTRGQHDYGTSRLVDSEWTGSPPNGEPRTWAPTAPTPDSDSDGTYHHGPRSIWTRSCNARLGSDSRTKCHPRRSDQLGPGTRHPSVFIS
jgi:hypothetical protein